MTDAAFPILYALFVWWFSTGIALYVVRLPDKALPWTLAACVVVLGLSLAAIAQNGAVATKGGAYLAFTAAILVWGVIEVAFLTGVVTGPWRQECPKTCDGWQRTGYAILAILHHEIALLVAGGMILALTWNAENQVGWLTFFLLWVMRLSAKLNLFLGVPISNAELLPARVKFIGSFFRNRPVNVLFPLSVTTATLATMWLVQAALSPTASPLHATGYWLLATLMALALLEHWFMMIPLPVIAIWKWGLRGSVQDLAAGGATPSAPDECRVTLIEFPEKTPMAPAPRAIGITRHIQ